MKKIKYNLGFFIFYSGFLTSDLFLSDKSPLYNVLSAAIRAFFMVALYYLYDCHNERKLMKTSL
jgi:hypothetical protein